MTIVGVDIGKHEHQATVVDPRGEVIGGTIRFENTARGFSSLTDHIDAFSQDESLIALEATGHYWLPLYLYLVDHGYRVRVFNPYQSDALRRIYLGRAKTDKIDSELVARLARLGDQKPTRLAGEEFINMRTLSRFRMELVWQASDTKRKIIAVMDHLFPEFEKQFSDMFGKTAVSVLENHPTPDELLSISEEKLVSLIQDASKGCLGKQTAQKLQETAAESIGISLGSEALIFELRLLLEQLKVVRTQINSVEDEIENVLSHIDQQLTTIPGVGMATAATILGEIGDINRFKNVGSLVAYAGLDPTVRESGTVEKKRKLSKRGSRYLRTALWQSAVSGVVYNKQLKKLYKKKRSEGRPRKVALGAVANKLTRIVYGILKSGTEYRSPD